MAVPEIKSIIRRIVEVDLPQAELFTTDLPVDATFLSAVYTPDGFKMYFDVAPDSIAVTRCFKIMKAYGDYVYHEAGHTWQYLSTISTKHGAFHIFNRI